MNIEVDKAGTVRDHQCISCMKCTSEEKCPVKKTVTFPVRNWILGLGIAVLIFGGIGVASALDLWQTSGSGTPNTYKGGAYDGQYDPSDIRGSYTMSQVADTFGIPLEDIGQAFALTGVADYGTVKLSQVESMFPGLPEGVEIGTDTMRYFVAWYLSLPIDDPDGVWFLKPGADLLLEKATLTDAQRAYLETHAAAVPSGGADASAPKTEETATAFTIKGNTTFGEVLAAGLSQAEIEKVLGRDMPIPATGIRAFCSEAGLAFEDVKTALTEALAAK
jgi:hypothetical protein